MGAVEEAQIREAVRVTPEDRPEMLGLARQMVRVLSMVADDLTGVIEEMEGHEADTALAHHALGVVTGAIGVLAEAPEA